MPFRLKSIELNGYKTFAKPTVFEFAESITAIVGPNGSGKSNIADALRWVLGEQSYHLLRGRKTDDMIFSGSETRPKAGMASATLIFDNSDGWLPIDFSEVSVTRRAYRSGQNEYLINNQKVRLRDINELLSQSGLAERTYTVIGQGLVDVALSLNSVERRRLFEEAAGIGIYRNRKDQAVRRLEKTNRNLERVRDIVAELKPRLRNLSRQAQRAQEHEQVKTDLQEVLREWYGFHWHKTQKELKDARSASQLQEVNRNKVRLEQEALSDKLDKSRETIASLRQSLAQWHQKLSEMHSQNETVNRDLAVGEERKNSLELQDDNLTQAKNTQEAELDLLTIQVDHVSAETNRLKDLVEEANHQLRQVESLSSVRLAERNEIDQTINDIKEQLDIALKRKVEVESHKHSLEFQFKSYQERQSQQQTHLDESTSLAQVAKEELTAVEKELEEDNKRFEQIKVEHEQNKRITEQLEQENTEISNKKLEVETKVASLDAQLDVLEQAELNLTGYARGAQVLLEAAKQKTLSGEAGVLSSYLNISPEYEIAIAAALGDFAGAVILDGKTDSDKALNLIQSEAASAALLPVLNINPREVLEDPKTKDCLGVASDLVQVPSKLRRVVEALLGQVLVMRSRNAARKILKGFEPHVIAVTLTGEVFHNSGAIYVDSKGGSGILSRPRKRRDLDERLSKERAALRKIEQAQIKSEKKMQKANDNLLESEKKSMLVRDDLESNQNHHRTALLKLDKNLTQEEWHQTQLKIQISEHQRSLDELENFTNELVKLQEEIKEHELHKKNATIELSALSVDEFQTQVTHWKTQLAVGQRGLDDAQNRQKDRELALEKVKTEMLAWDQRKQELVDKDSSLKDMSLKSRVKHEDLTKEINSLQALIQPAEQELQELEEEQDSLLREESKGRQALNVAERHNSQAQIAYARHQESLETLQRRVEDDFGLVAFEYDDAVSGPTPLPFGELVEQLPMVAELSPDIDETLKRQRTQLRRMGSINPEAQLEFEQVQERSGFLSTQIEDLTKAEKDIREVIAELDTFMEREFRKTFDVVAEAFRENFSRLFGGGSARLLLTDNENMAETGVDIEARLPGKRAQRLAMLSGGERSLTAAALVFALLKASPTPFCVMDEVDAMLDEANIGRFRDLLIEYSKKTQFIVITHNRNTVTAADVIYGVTMGRDTVSQVIGLKIDEVDERYAVGME